MTPEASRRRRIRTPVLAVTALAWLVTVVLQVRATGPGHGSSGMAGMPGMADMPGMAPSPTDQHDGLLPGSTLAFLAGWPLMLTAMMAPLLIPALRHSYARSLPRRRWRAVALFVAGYTAIWTAAGLVLREIAAGLPVRGGAVIGLLAALAWQLSPVKQRCLNRQHAHPALAAFGRAADLDAVRFGAVHAVWCVGCCWALMLLPLLATHWPLVVMAGVTLWIWAESFDKPARPNWRIRLPGKAARIVAGAGRSLLPAATNPPLADRPANF